MHKIALFSYFSTDSLQILYTAYFRHKLNMQEKRFFIKTFYWFSFKISEKKHEKNHSKIFLGVFFIYFNYFLKITDLEAATFPKASPLIEKCDIVAFFFILKKRILRY